MSNMFFQYPTTLSHNVFSVFYSDVITQNVGNYQTDMMISSTALNKSIIIIIVINNINSHYYMFYLKYPFVSDKLTANCKIVISTLNSGMK